MEIKLKDSSFSFLINDEKKRYLNNEEIFYLKNEVDGRPANISGPSGYDLVFTASYSQKNKNKSKGSLEVTGVQQDSSSFTLIDSSNNIVVFEFDVNSDQNNPGSTISESKNIKIGISGIENNFSSIAEHIKNVINSVNTFNQIDLEDLNTNNNQTLNITASIDSSNNNKIILRQINSGSSGDTTISVSTNINNFNKEDFSRHNDIIKLDIDSSELNKVYNFSGEEIVGLKKVTINNTDLNRYDEFLKEELDLNDYVNFDITWEWKKAGEHIESYVIKKKSVKFYCHDTQETSFNNEKNIRISLINKSKNIYANNTIQKLEVMFYDIKNQYKTAKLPYDLPCINLGNVCYEVKDENGNILIKNNKEYSSLIWNGKNYEFDFYVSELFKNKILEFNFYLDNDLYKTKMILNNKNIKIKAL